MRSRWEWRGAAACILSGGAAATIVLAEINGRPVPDGILGALVGILGAYVVGARGPWGR